MDPLDPAYLDVRILIDNGLAPRSVLGARELSRAELARIIDTAERDLARRNSPSAGTSGKPSVPAERLGFLDQLLRSLRERLDLPDTGAATSGLTSRFAPIRTISLDVTSTDQPTRLIPVDNGLGSIDGRLNTLLIDRQGRVLASGTNAILESTHSFETNHVAFQATPQLFTRANANGDRRLDMRLQELQLRFLYRNAALDVGREYLVWGQGREGGLLNSNNSPPLDLVKLSSESPFHYPWFLHALGPSRFSIFFADLGGDQNFPHPYEVGYRFNIAPADWLELGASVYTKAGGKGGPPATTTARLIDLLPFLDASAYNNKFGTRGVFQFSDHYAGVDGRVHLPAGNAAFYWELLFNDFDVRRLESVLWEDAGHIVGLDLPSLAPSGRLDLSLEYHHTGLRYYEHQQFTSGQTLHQVLTGDPLGPNAQGAYLDLDWYASAARRLGLQLALERRSNDQYAYIPEPNFGFTRTGIRPKEWQGRAVATWRVLPERHQLGAQLQFGYERTRNFDFADGADRNGFLGRATVEYRFF